jgi:dTDP-4-amino-4,6-dideoxygalactose transaminase
LYFSSLKIKLDENTTFPFENPLYGESFSYKKGLCPKEEKTSQDLLLPVYYTLNKEDLDDVINAIRKIVTYLNELKE